MEALASHVRPKKLAGNQGAPTSVERPHRQDGVHVEAARQEVVDRGHERLRVPEISMDGEEDFERA